MSCDRLFELFKISAQPGHAADLFELLSHFKPLLEVWALDVLKRTAQRSNPDWRFELVDLGVGVLLEAIPQLQSKKVKSGDHLVNWLRLIVRKEMRKEWRKMSGILSDSDPSLLAAIEEGAPLYLPGHPLRRVESDPMMALRIFEATDSGRESVGAWIIDGLIEPDSDGRQKRYDEFAFRVLSEACAEAKARDWDFIELMWQYDLSTSEVARKLRTSRSVIRDRLKLIGQTVAAAMPELNELGVEFLDDFWISAVKKGQKRLKTPGPRFPNGRAA